MRSRCFWPLKNRLKKWDSQRHWSKGENKFYNAGEENAGARFWKWHVCVWMGEGEHKIVEALGSSTTREEKEDMQGQKQVGDRTFASIFWWVSNPYVQSLSLLWPKTHCLAHLTSTNTGFPTSTSASSCPKPRSTRFLLIHAFYCITTWHGEEKKSQGFEWYGGLKNRQSRSWSWKMGRPLPWARGQKKGMECPKMGWETGLGVGWLGSNDTQSSHLKAVTHLEANKAFWQVHELSIVLSTMFPRK